MAHGGCGTEIEPEICITMERTRTSKGTSIRSLNGHVEVAQVVIVGCSRDTGSGVSNQTFCFLSMVITATQYSTDIREQG